MRTALLLSTAALLLPLVACGDDALTRDDCPGKPEKIALRTVAPFWNGLVALSFTSTGKGSPTFTDVQLFDPALGAYGQTGGSVTQKEDGTFLAQISTPVRQENKDLAFKVRVRSALDGCAPSDWAESPTFKLGDPISSTTWKADLSLAELAGNIDVSYFGPLGTAVGPYSFAPSGVQHAITFAADGTFTETLDLGIVSEHAGDLYSGCHFQLHAGGRWAIVFPNYGMSLVLADRKLAANPLEGSSCGNPSPASLMINQIDATTGLLPSTPGLNIDYSGLLYSPPGKVKWQDSLMIGALASALSELGFSNTSGSATVTASLSTYLGHYEKQ